MPTIWSRWPWAKDEVDAGIILYLQILARCRCRRGSNTAYAGRRSFQFRTTAAETIEIDYIQLTLSEELCWRQVLAMDTGHVANSIFGG